MIVERISGKVPLAALSDLTEMMMRLKHETEPDTATDDEWAYFAYIKHKLKTAFVYYIPQVGFCIIDKAYDPLLSCPHCHFFMMTHIYIVPEKRKTRVYAKLFHMALNSHNGQMIGLTFATSGHNAVLAKRYKKIGTIYGRY